MPRCYISLGGNLGSVGNVFDEVLARIGRKPNTTVVAASHYFQTKPVGASAGGEFLNAAAEIDTPLPPLDLLDLLQSIESDLGRSRTIRWGPRSLDLDILFYGSEIINVPRLVIPHPAAWYRRFVLDPLVEIASGFMHPERQATIESLRERLLARPLVVAFAGESPEFRTELIGGLAPAFPQVSFRDWEIHFGTGTSAGAGPALIFWLGSEVRRDDRPLLEFRQLPVRSRLDVANAPEPPAEFMRHVLESALG